MTGVEWAETQPLDPYLWGIAFGGSVYVAAGDSGIFTSPDGAAWTEQRSAGLGWSKLRYSSGKFLALGGDSGVSKIGISPDGITWATALLRNRSVGDAATDGQSVIITADGSILRSTDGASWTEVYHPTNAGSLVAFGNGLFVVPGKPVLVSSDGVNWEPHPGFSDLPISDLIFANGRFYASESAFIYNTESRIFSSPDGVRWSSYKIGSRTHIYALAAGPQGLFATGPGSVILHSPWDLTLNLLERFNDGTVRLQVGGNRGQTVIVESSATLGSPSWRPIWTNTISDRSLTLIDAGALTSPQRFYRAVGVDP
jgi:hypothetical protein